MNLTLAVAETCGPDGCQVKMVNDGRSMTARYSALVLNRVKIRPGQLVAIDLDPAEPEVAWRWHRARVIETAPEGARLEDRGCRQVDAAIIPGLEMDLSIGDEVWFTGFGGGWEIHAKIINDEPARPDPVKDLVLPRVAEQLSNRPAAQG